MPVTTDSPAVAVALGHIKAWSNHDFDTARTGLAPEVRITATTPLPIMEPVDLTGVDDYMIGLIGFARTVTPGSAHILTTLGDDRNALVLLTVETDFGAGKMTLPGARLYLLDDDDKIQVEQVVFFATPA